jgi:hypothetical protein
MIKSVNILQPVMVQYENNSQIFFMDPMNQKVFDFSYKEVPQDLSDDIFYKMNEQVSENLPEMPLKEIYEVMNTERQLSEDNDKHIFRRN